MLKDDYVKLYKGLKPSNIKHDQFKIIPQRSKKIIEIPKI